MTVHRARTARYQVPAYKEFVECLELRDTKSKRASKSPAAKVHDKDESISEVNVL